MKIFDIVSFLDGIAPREWQENYDNAGLIVGNEQWECTGVLVCLDSTEDIIQEAIDNHCNLVIAHHPIIFTGLKRINGDHYVEKAIITAIKHDIAIFAIHTNLDNAYWNGVNAKISEKLELLDTSLLLPKKWNDQNEAIMGAGMTGYLKSPMKTMDFLNYLKSKMNLPLIKYTPPIKPTIHKVAVCGGSGSFLISDAKNSQADIYITSDIKYHEFFEANHQIIIADIGHFESEKYTIELLYNIIQNNFTTFAVHFTKHITNPVNYL